ncbi:MAG TPA: hypothetical protein DCL66_14405, partial [Gammaproteobacteria bacterium]|nr:hypothetical protein [Gammaproteobacteria bacterium]
MTFMGQAIIKDLQALNGTRATDTALGAMLRLTKNSASNDINSIALQNNELDQYLVAKTDPSQEEAVKFARNEPGTLIKGPPGTGKSQTLTHIVADCLGRGESVLICTQKQAALEVVRKRLVAEGLQSRVVMVQDVNKDRRSVIKSIREHQESVRQSSDRQEKIMTERRQLAAKISSCEGELDKNHKVLFDRIGKTGRSYRDVITELLTIEDMDENLPVDCPEIRSIVQYLPIDDLVNLEERVAALVPLWLEAEPQKSANENLLSFGWEKSKCDLYRTQLKALFHSEKKRLSKHPRANNVFTIENVDRARTVVSSCLRTYPKVLKDRIHLAKWIDLFTSKNDKTVGQGLINNLV